MKKRKKTEKNDYLQSYNLLRVFPLESIFVLWFVIAVLYIQYDSYNSKPVEDQQAQKQPYSPGCILMNMSV